MVKVDDATYVAMRDNLYKWDAATASRAKAQIESSYTDEQYNDFVTKLGNIWTQRAEVSNPTQTTTPTAQPTEQATQQPTQTAPEVKQETAIKQAETTGSTVPEIKQEWALKPLSQDYYNQTSDDAQDKIVKNLNDYKQSNPEYFTDYESFKRNFSYDARDDIQKNTLDEWYKWYQQGLEFSTTPVNDLYNQYNSGQLSATQLQSLRVTDPTKYAELQAQINKWNIIAAYDDDKWDATNMSFQDMAYQMMQKTFMQFMNWWSDSGATQFFAEYKDRMNSPEMVRLSDESAELQEQIENVQSDIANMKKAVEKEYEWTWATRSKINAIIADRTYELQTQLQTLDSQYKRVATQYNNRMQQYSSDFELQLQEYQLWMQERNQKMDELWFAMDLMNFETNEQKQQREWDYWVKQQEYTNWNINSKDYDTRYKAALKSVQNLLSQYEGIPMQRSAEQMASDILKAIDNGSDLWTELTKINKQIQGKPEYKYLYNNTFKSSTTWGIGKTYKIWDTEYVDYNGQLYTAEEFNKQFWGKTSSKAYNSVSAEAMSTWLDNFTSNLSKYKGYGWQCAKFVNDYLAEIWVGRYFGTEDAKTRAGFSNSDTPTIWSIAIFDYNQASDDWKNYGHVGIVTDITQSGDLIILDSNFGKDWKIQYRTVNPNSASLKWFFDPTIPYGWSNGENKNQPTSVDKLTLTALRNWQIVNSKVPETIDQLVKAGFSEDEINEALNQNMEYYLPDDQRAEKNAILNSFRSNEIVKNFQSATEQFLWLSAAVNEANWAWDLASIYMFMRSQDPRSVVREWEFEMAASTMWLWWQVQTWFSKLSNWERLTPEQRQNFIDVTVKVLEAKKQAYKLVYDEAVNQMKAASIPSVYYPTDWATELDWIIAKLEWTTPQSTNQSTFQSTTTTRWKNMSSFLETPQNWISTLPKASDVFKVNTNVWWSNVPSNFY